MIRKSLPSAFTVGNLFLGVLAIIFVFNNKFESAAIMVIIAMLLDSLDGRVARALNAQSEFGKELDSLSDVISFGVAPAFIMYVAAFTELNSATAWIVTAIFPICGALRLARFNVIAGVPGYFIGLPIPAAGGVLCTLALFHTDLSPYILLFCTLLLSFLMVSTIKYPSFKKGRIPKAVLYVTPIIIVIAVWVGITYRGSVAKMILVPLLLYALYGLKKNVDILFARMTRRHRRNRARQSQIEETYKSDSRM